MHGRAGTAGRRGSGAPGAWSCASGGFEANLDWLRRYWGDAVDNYIIRGTPDNDGRVLAALYADGAARAGEEKGFHAVALDARSPRFDGGIATRLDSIPFGIVVNRAGERFYDEGEDIWPKRYAIWGRNIAEQPGQIAYSIWDAKVNRPVPAAHVRPGHGRLASATWRRELGLDRARSPRRSPTYNAAVGPAARFDPSRPRRLPHGRTDPPKSHWAQPIDTPPFYGIAMRPGITFTYMGVRGHPRGAGAAAGRRGVRATCSRPARSCRATSCPPATWPGSA